MLLPRPQLRAYEINDGNAEPVELVGKAEMDIGKVDEHSHVRPPCANRFLQLAELAVDAWQMSQHFRQSHDGYVFRADDAFYAGGLHSLATHAKQLRCYSFCSKLLLDRSGQQGAVVFAACLACRDEDGWGHEVRDFPRPETMIAAACGNAVRQPTEVVASHMESSDAGALQSVSRSVTLLT